MNKIDRKELTNFWKHGINPITGFKEDYYNDDRLIKYHSKNRKKQAI
tara:strand:- start:2255 stop:2395 length:141 start_codon:yes stop_codon:yes gene_type:complete